MNPDGGYITMSNLQTDGNQSKWAAKTTHNHNGDQLQLPQLSSPQRMKQHSPGHPMEEPQ